MTSPAERNNEKSEVKNVTPDDVGQQTRTSLELTLEAEIIGNFPNFGITSLKRFYKKRGKDSETEDLVQVHHPLIFIVAETLREMRKQVSVLENAGADNAVVEDAGILQATLLKQMGQLSEQLATLMWTTDREIKEVKKLILAWRLSNGNRTPLLSLPGIKDSYLNEDFPDDLNRLLRADSLPEVLEVSAINEWEKIIPTEFASLLAGVKKVKIFGIASSGLMLSAHTAQKLRILGLTVELIAVSPEFPQLSLEGFQARAGDLVLILDDATASGRTMSKVIKPFNVILKDYPIIRGDRGMIYFV